jgi:hypothetical protein
MVHSSLLDDSDDRELLFSIAVDDGLAKRAGVWEELLRQLLIDQRFLHARTVRLFKISAC